MADVGGLAPPHTAVYVYTRVLQLFFLLPEEDKLGHPLSHPHRGAVPVSRKGW